MKHGLLIYGDIDVLASRSEEARRRVNAGLAKVVAQSLRSLQPRLSIGSRHRRALAP